MKQVLLEDGRSAGRTASVHDHEVRLTIEAAGAWATVTYGDSGRRLADGTEVWVMIEERPPTEATT